MLSKSFCLSGTNFCPLWGDDITLLKMHALDSFKQKVTRSDVYHKKYNSDKKKKSGLEQSDTGLWEKPTETWMIQVREDRKCPRTVEGRRDKYGELIGAGPKHRWTSDYSPDDLEWAGSMDLLRENNETLMSITIICRGILAPRDTERKNTQVLHMYPTKPVRRTRD